MTVSNNVSIIFHYICGRKYKRFSDYKVAFSHLILLFFVLSLKNMIHQRY